jgi:hypothetical protein
MQNDPIDGDDSFAFVHSACIPRAFRAFRAFRAIHAFRAFIYTHSMHASPGCFPFDRFCNALTFNPVGDGHTGSQAILEQS